MWGFLLSVIFSRLKGFAFCYPFQAETQHFLGVRELLEVGAWPVDFVAITVVKCGLWSQAAGALTWTPSYSCCVTRGKLATPVVPLSSIKWGKQYPVTWGSVLQWEVRGVAGQALNFGTEHFPGAHCGVVSVLIRGVTWRIAGKGQWEWDSPRSREVQAAAPRPFVFSKALLQIPAQCMLDISHQQGRSHCCFREVFPDCVLLLWTLPVTCTCSESGLSLFQHHPYGHI